MDRVTGFSNEVIVTKVVEVVAKDVEVENDDVVVVDVVGRVVEVVEVDITVVRCASGGRTVCVDMVVVVIVVVVGVVEVDVWDFCDDLCVFIVVEVVDCVETSSYDSYFSFSRTGSLFIFFDVQS